MAPSPFLLSARAHFCSRLVLNFALGTCSFLFSARAQFCSLLVLIFVLGLCSFLFSARAHFCSATTARTHFRSPTVARTRDLCAQFYQYPRAKSGRAIVRMPDRAGCYGPDLIPYQYSHMHSCAIYNWQFLLICMHV